MYSQALQLRLCQAFIYSMPILFSITLFLFFYIFYTKRMSSMVSSPSQPLSTLSQPTPLSLYSLKSLKETLKGRLPVILLDEGSSTNDSIKINQISELIFVINPTLYLTHIIITKLYQMLHLLGRIRVQGGSAQASIMQVFVSPGMHLSLASSIQLHLSNPTAQL
ncbi:hypothetical protein Pfo_025756, partial [Paulownia fortunei]